MPEFSPFSLLFTVIILTGNFNFRPTTATITSYSTDQVSCTMCDECENPCQLSPPLPPPPPPSADDNCPPPPAPPSSGGNSPPTTTPSAPTFPYYSPPPPPIPTGIYGYATPPPPNPILPYFPFYYYNPPPPHQNSFSIQLQINRFHVLFSVLIFLLLFV